MDIPVDEEFADLNVALIDPIKFLEDLLLESSYSDKTILYLSLKHNFCDELISVIMKDYVTNLDSEYEGYDILLHLAVKRETTLITRKLLEYGVNILSLNVDGYTPLHIAIKDNRLDQLEELLKWLKEPLDNVRCSSSETPLMFGIYYESSDDVLLTLLNHGCDVNIQDEDGFAALHYCASRESSVVAKKIIESGADLDIRNYMDDTPLHSAVSADHLEYVCMLLYYNASADERNKLGRTPFHETIYEELGSEDRPNAEAIARNLLDYVVDYEAKNANGDTVLDTALRKHTNIIPDLLERGFDINILRCGFYNERVHILYLAWKYCSSYEVLKSFWYRTNFELFVTTELLLVDCTKTYLEAFCMNCKLPDDQFLQYLYMMFNSPYITDFSCSPKHNATKCVIHSIVSKRNFTLETRLELIWLFASYGAQIYIRDISSLYDKYGFDKSVELLLMVGCCILPNPFESVVLMNLIVHRMCFDNIDEYIRQGNEDLSDDVLYMSDESEDEGSIFENEFFMKLHKKEMVNQRIYCKFYRATFYNKYNRVRNLHGISATGELPSLVELSRNVVRKVIYEKWSTPSSFRVYQALSALPVPNVIRDILFLRTPIYTH